jgi:hypothetical protein
MNLREIQVGLLELLIKNNNNCLATCAFLFIYEDDYKFLTFGNGKKIYEKYKFIPSSIAQFQFIPSAFISM